MNAILNRKDYFTTTYSNYYKVIYCAVMAKIRNCEESRDICQEIFTRLFECFDKIINPRKWLFGTMRYVLYEYYHKELKNKSDLAIDDMEENPGLCCENMIDEKQIIIDRALSSISSLIDEQDKLIFDYIALNGFTQKKTAKLIGMTIHQVRYRYQKILRHLVDYFNKHGIHTLSDLM